MSPVRVVDHTAVAKVFMIVRKATGDVPSAMRVALVAYRAMVPGLHGISVGTSVDELAHLFDLGEREIRSEGFDLNPLERTEKALRGVLFSPKTVPVPLAERLIARAVADACASSGLTEAQLRGPSSVRSITNVRVALWQRLRGETVGVREIARHFHRDHSTVSKCVAKRERRMLEGGDRRGPVAAPVVADVVDARRAA